MNGTIFSVLLSIMSNSVFSCIHLSYQIGDPRAMSKRQMQEKRTRRRWARGCNIETCATSCLYDSQSVSSSAEFELISQPGESWETCRDGFEWEQCIKFSSVAHRFCPQLKNRTPVARSKKNTIGQILTSQFDFFATQCQICGQSLRDSATETWSSRRRRQNGSDRNLSTKIWIKFSCYEEHRIIQDSALVSITQKLVFDQQYVIFRVSTVDLDQTSWMKKYFSTWTCYQVIDSNSKRLFGFGAVLWRQNCRLSPVWRSYTGQNRVIYWLFSM